MDVSELANGMRELARRRGHTFGADLESDERVMRELCHEVGAAGLEQELNEQPLGYDGSQRPCPCCEQWQRFVKHGERTLVTLLGPVRVRRAYYHCTHCGCGSLPWDEQVGLGRGQASVAVAKAATWCASHEPFETAATKLKELAGVSLSRSTVHRLVQQVGRAVRDEAPAAQVLAAPPASAPQVLYTAVDGAMVHIDGRWQEVKAATCYWEDEQDDHSRYLVRHEPAEDFAPRAGALARRCGHEQAAQNVLLGDGSKWIWHHVGGELRPQTTHIADWYHVNEQVWAAANALHGQGTAAAEQWVRPIKAMLWEGQLRRLRGHMDEQVDAATSDEARRACGQLRTYLLNQGDRLVYDDFRAAGYDIGSGRVEAACKHVVQARAKRSGMRWSHTGLQHVMTLRCTYLNGAGPDLWGRQPLRSHLLN